MKKLSVCLLLLLWSAMSLYAQSDRSATVKGRVIDLHGAVIPNAEVTATDGSGKVVKVFTNASGTYKLSLIGGIYLLKFTRAPFDTFQISEYQVVTDIDMNLDVSLTCKKYCDSHDEPLMK